MKWIFFPAIVLLFLALFLTAAAPVPAQDSISRVGLEYFKNGVHHFNRKEYEASIDFFRKSLSESPANERTHFFLGMAYYKAGFDESALFEFNNILNLDKGDEILQNFARYLNLKQFFLREKKINNDYTIGMQIPTNKIGRYILSKATGIDVDETGNIYVAGFGSKIALKISQDGEPLFAFTDPRISQGRVYDIVVGKNGEVYLSDFTKDTIYKFEKGSEERYIELENIANYAFSIGSTGFAEGQFYGPTSLALDDKGDLYAVDTGNVRIQKFSGNGDFLMAFGKEGDFDGEMKRPVGVAVDHTGNIYVSDQEKKNIQVYDKSGNFITVLDGVDLTEPGGISIVDDSKLLVSDKNRIMIYDILYSTWEEIETGGRLKKIVDTKIDRLGQLYTFDYDSDQIYQFVPKADKYRNLNVILDRIDTSDYPVISYYVTVLDADGFPIYGLVADNFLLKIGGGVVGKIDMSHNEVKNSRQSLLFLVDKSPAMQDHSEDINSYINQFISMASPEDEMAVINFNSESWIASPFTRSRLRTMESVLEEKYEPGKVFDRAFRRGIDYLNKEFYKKALIVITDGRFDNSSFKTYSFDSCMKYASNNHIPVYFLSFGGSPNARLEYFARGTGGKFYDVLHSNEFPYLYDTIKGYRPAEYLIFFNDEYDPTLANFFLEAEVEVDYNDRVGKNRLGMVYP
jgi:hypothetical protein